MASRNQFYKKLMVAQSAINTAVVLPRDQVSNIQELAVYVVFGALTSAGVVVVESAPDPDYTGVWVLLGTVTWSAVSKAHLVAITGAHLALRVRISTGIVGGTVDAYACGN